METNCPSNVQRRIVSLIGIVAEQQHESRVAATPETLRVILSLGYQGVVEKGSGAIASRPDDSCFTAGLITCRRSNIFLAVIGKAEPRVAMALCLWQAKGNLRNKAHPSR